MRLSLFFAAVPVVISNQAIHAFAQGPAVHRQVLICIAPNGSRADKDWHRADDFLGQLRVFSQPVAAEPNAEFVL